MKRKSPREGGLEEFEILGDNHRLLVEAIRLQPFVESSPELAAELAAVAILEKMDAGQHLIEQGASDNDLILNGILRNAAKVFTRRVFQAYSIASAALLKRV